MNIKPDELAQAIQNELREYEGATVNCIKTAVDRAAKEAVAKLKSDSPRRAKHGGAYAKDWSSKNMAQKNAWAYGKVVFNKSHYRLTHLLEKGRWKTQGGKGARPHIEKVEKESIDELTRLIKEGV